MELVTLKNLKTYLEITDTNQDALLSLIIRYVSGLMRVYVGWEITKTNVENQQCDSYQSINRLNGYPIWKADEVDEEAGDLAFKYEYNAGTLATPSWKAMLTENYFVNYDEGIIETIAPMGGFKDIRFSYTYGYDEDELPAEIEAAALKACGRMYNRRKSEGIANESIENASVNWNDKLSEDEILVLDAYTLSGSYIAA